MDQGTSYWGWAWVNLTLSFPAGWFIKAPALISLQTEKFMAIDPQQQQHSSMVGV